MASCKYPLLMYDIVKLLWLFFYSLLQQFDKLSPSNSSSVLCGAVGADVYISKPFVLLQEFPHLIAVPAASGLTNLTFTGRLLPDLGAPTL